MVELCSSRALASYPFLLMSTCIRNNQRILVWLYKQDHQMVSYSGKDRVLEAEAKMKETLFFCLFKMAILYSGKAFSFELLCGWNFEHAEYITRHAVSRKHLSRNSEANAPILMVNLKQSIFWAISIFLLLLRSFIASEPFISCLVTVFRTSYFNYITYCDP